MAATTDVFPFELEDVVEQLLPSLEVVETDLKSTVAREVDRNDTFEARVQLVFPQAISGKVSWDLIKFWRDHRRGLDTVLYVAAGPELRTAVETFDGDSLTTDFFLTYKHVVEDFASLSNPPPALPHLADSLVVKISDVVQNPADYTLMNNHTVPFVRFDSAPATGTDNVQIEYNHAYPARCFIEPNPEHKLGGTGRASAGIRLYRVRLAEALPGARFVTPSTAVAT